MHNPTFSPSNVIYPQWDQGRSITLVATAVLPTFFRSNQPQRGGHACFVYVDADKQTDMGVLPDYANAEGRNTIVLERSSSVCGYTRVLFVC
jgi:hypothetical protein